MLLRNNPILSRERDGRPFCDFCRTTNRASPLGRPIFITTTHHNKSCTTPWCDGVPMPTTINKSFVLRSYVGFFHRELRCNICSSKIKNADVDIWKEDGAFTWALSPTTSAVSRTNRRCTPSCSRAPHSWQNHIKMHSFKLPLHGVSQIICESLSYRTSLTLRGRPMRTGTIDTPYTLCTPSFAMNVAKVTNGASSVSCAEEWWSDESLKILMLRHGWQETTKSKGMI